jgi:hypothetical protein
MDHLPWPGGSKGIEHTKIAAGEVSEIVGD